MFKKCNHAARLCTGRTYETDWVCPYSLSIMLSNLSKVLIKFLTPKLSRIGCLSTGLKEGRLTCCHADADSTTFHCPETRFQIDTKIKC